MIDTNSSKETMFSSPASWSRLTVSLSIMLMMYAAQFLHFHVHLTLDSIQKESSSPRTLVMSSFLGGAASSTVNAFNYSNHKFCLIHVGKAAGSKVSCELGYAYAPECRKKRSNSSSTDASIPSSLQQHRGGVRHMGMAIDCTEVTNDNQVFVVTVRHPVHRLISWYYYEHLRNGKIRMNPRVKRGKSCLNRFHHFRNNTGCFQSLQDFAMNTLPPSHNTSLTECQTLAWKVASGATNCMWHNGMGYQYYMNIMNEIVATNNTLMTPHILLMRAEHLQDDWNSSGEIVWRQTHEQQQY